VGDVIAGPGVQLEVLSLEGRRVARVGVTALADPPANVVASTTARKEH